MAIKNSAAVLICRVDNDDLKILLIRDRDNLLGKWSFPKGEFDPEKEHPADAAVREVAEEIGICIPANELIPLGKSVYRNKRKRIHCFLWEAKGPLHLTLDEREIGEAAFVTPVDAKSMLHEASIELVDKAVIMIQHRMFKYCGPQSGTRNILQE